MKSLFCFLSATTLAAGTFSLRAQADPPTVQPPPTIATVTASRTATTEGSSEPAVFTIKRTGPVADSLLIFYRTGGSAVNGVDYKELSGSVLIPGGAASVDVPVLVIDDKIAEEEETVVLTLVSPIRPLTASTVSLPFGYQIGEPGSAVVNIKDNDSDVKLPTIGIAAPVPEAAEEGPKNGEFVASRFGRTEDGLVVKYEILTDPVAWPPGGIFDNELDFPIFLVLAAKNGTDYKTLSGSVSIPPGEKSANILVEPINDQLREGREHVTLRLKASDAYNINAPNTATVFILDNDPNAPTPRVKILEPSSGSSFPLGKEIHIAAQAEASQGFVKTVEFFADSKSLGLTESNPLSASPINPFQLVWKGAAPGQHTLTAKAMDDAGRTTLSEPVQIRVLDSPNPTIVTIYASVPEAREGDPNQPGIFKVVRTGNLKDKLNVHYKADGSAKPGVDYAELPGVVTIPEGESSAPIVVHPIPHNSITGTATVIVTLQQLVFVAVPPPEEQYVVGEPSSAKVVISQRIIRPQPPKATIDEPHGGDKFSEHTDIKVHISTADADGYVPKIELFDGNKLIASEHREFFAKPPPGQLEIFDFVWHEAPAGKHRLVARATDDTGVAGESSAVEIDVLGTTTVPVVSIKATKPEVLESGSGDPGRFTVSRTGSSGTKLNVHYIVTGTAQNGTDYDELSGTVTIPAGEGSARILIKPVPDKALEGNETVTLTLEQRVYIVAPPPEENYLVGDSKSATVIIVEKPARGTPPKVEIMQPKEGDIFAENATIKVEIQTADADGYVPRMELYDGDKLIDSETRDFLIKPPPGQIEQFAFEWKEASAGQHKLIAKATDDLGLSSTSSPVKITVGRNTDAPVVTITAPDGEASEADPKNTATFQVHRAGSTKTALHVYYEIGGNAANGEDYEKLPGMVTIPAGDDDAKIVVFPIPDRKVEGKELVTLSLVERIFKAPPGPEDNYRVGLPGSATIVISDSPSQNIPPKIAIVSPRDGADFPAQADIELRAEAADSDGELREVDFFANDELLVSFKTPPFRYTWKDVAAGKYLLRAKAADDGGASTMSESVTILVRERGPAGFVKRQLPEFYTPGETFKVVLEASPQDAVQVYAIEERPPKGWTVENINEGGSFDSASREVKFGPFFDNKPRTLIYEITPPANESGPKEFNGVASANGANSEIGGDRVLAPRSTRHPADIDSADNRITVQELTAYALAWKTGKNWSIGPNPIPQGYVTRAGEIWRRGESYTFDPNQGPAPLWWVPKQSAALLALGAVVAAGDDVSGHPGRAVRSFERNGTDAHLAYLVTVKVVPGAGTNAYATEERPPDGWTVSDVSDDGIFDELNGRIRWGIFLDNKARELTYRVSPPAEQGHHQAVFEGVASFDGLDVPIHSDKEPDLGKGHAFGKLKNIYRHSTGECEVSFSGETGHQYKIQVSTNLVNWIDLAPVRNEAGETQVFDMDATKSPVRYYRAILSD